MEEKIQKDNFRIGDRVKLKNYTEYNDWLRHSGQNAIISDTDSSLWDYSIVWSDGKKSGVNRNNLIFDNLDWDN